MLAPIATHYASQRGREAQRNKYSAFLYNNCHIITECIIGDDDDDIHVATGNDNIVKYIGQSTGPTARSSRRGRKAKRNV